MAPGSELTDRDRRVVRDVVDDLRAAPPPSNPARVGLPVALLGVLLFVVWPRFVDTVPGGGFISPFVTLLAVLMVLGGPAMALLGRGGGRRGAEAAVEAALRRLEDPESDGETRLRAATLLVVHAYTSQGPATVHTFDPTEVRARLGVAVELVEAVERLLVDGGEAYPAFTWDPERDG